MNPVSAPSNPAAASAASAVTASPSREAEAARYALMRRLAPAIRHNMAGALQPVSMIAAMLERRAQSATPDMAQLAKNSRDIGVLSREAASTCMDLMGWLAPKDNETVPVNAGIDEAIGLLATEMSFRGFTVDNQVLTLALKVPRGVLRSVFIASLIALTDAATEPASLVLTAEASGSELVLDLVVVPTGAQASPNPMHAYRLLDWVDVQALAVSEGALLATGEGRVSLRCAASASA